MVPDVSLTHREASVAWSALHREAEMLLRTNPLFPKIGCPPGTAEGWAQVAGGHLPLDQEQPPRTSAKRDKMRFFPLILALRVRAAGQVSLMTGCWNIPFPALR